MLLLLWRDYKVGIVVVVIVSEICVWLSVSVCMCWGYSNGDSTYCCKSFCEAMSFSNYPLRFLSYLFSARNKRLYVLDREENVEFIIYTYLQIRHAYSLQTFYRLPLEVSMLTLCLVSFFSLTLPWYDMKIFLIERFFLSWLNWSWRRPSPAMCMVLIMQDV